MLGRMRPSPISSLELLELERPNSKLIKDDSFSIYETTLLKLKQGSLRNPSPATDENCTTASDLKEDEAMIIDEDRSSTDSAPVYSSCESTSTDQRTKRLSIFHLFSRYKNSRQHSLSSPDGSDTSAGSGTSSDSASPSLGNSKFFSSSRQC